MDISRAACKLRGFSTRRAFSMKYTRACKRHVEGPMRDEVCSLTFCPSSQKEGEVVDLGDVTAWSSGVIYQCQFFSVSILTRARPVNSLSRPSNLYKLVGNDCVVVGKVVVRGFTSLSSTRPEIAPTCIFEVYNYRFRRIMKIDHGI